MDKKTTCAIILAAGSGSRMGIDTTKQQLTLLGKSVLRRTLEAFEGCVDIDSIVLVGRAGEEEFLKKETEGITKLYATVMGADTRARSAYNGFSAIPKDTDFVAIHDAARCLVTPKMISNVVADAVKYGAATACTRVSDTVKTLDENGFVSQTLDRNFVALAATPQIFSTYLYNRAIESAKELGAEVTDDNMLMEKTGVKVYCTDTGSQNIKITHSSDIAYAEFILKGRV